MITDRAEWQVLVLAENFRSELDADDINRNLSNIFKTIMMLSFPPAVKINFCINSDFYDEEIFGSGGRGEKEVPAEPVLQIFRLVPAEGQSAANSGNKLQLIAQKRSCLFSEPSTVAWAFRQCNQDVQFCRSMIISIDHGNGFGIFKSSGNTFNGRPPYLTMDDLADAISESFPNGKTDLLILQNCFMMTMDTLFALKDAADFLVAPQTIVCYYGYHYQEILQALSSNWASITPETLCRIAVTTVGQSPEYMLHPQYLGKLVLFGTKLWLYRKSRVWEIENGMLRILLRCDANQEGQIKAARKKIWSVTFTASLMLNVALIDTLAWFETCSRILQNVEFDAYLREYSAKMQSFFGGENPMTYRGNLMKLYNTMPVNGISYFMPYDNSEYRYACFNWFYKKAPSRYASQSELTNFLEKFYG